MSISWTEKYRPTKFDEIQGQQKAVSQLYEFVKNYKSNRQKAALIYGEPGCGKTSTVHTIAKELGLEIIEINASDVRNKAEIESKMGAVMHQQSLFFTSKLILMDEIDGVSGSKDRGGIPALTKLIGKSKFPIVMTANDPWDKKFASLRKNSLLIEFHTLAYPSLVIVLKKIAEKEGVEYNDNALTSLARRNGGDLRGAINDLQTLSGISKKLTLDDLDTLGERKHTESMHEALIKVLKTVKPEVALTAFQNVNENQDDIIMWLDENIPKEYEKAKDLAEAYDALSLADVYRRRIRRWQHWRFMVYINDFITAGVALAKDERYKKFVKYGPTTRILKMWQTNMKFGKRKEIARKIGKLTHSSDKYVIKHVLPYLKKMFELNHSTTKDMAEELELDNAEIAWLKKKL